MDPDVLTDKLAANDVVVTDESALALTEAFSADVAEFEATSGDSDEAGRNWEQFDQLDEDDPVLQAAAYSDTLVGTYASLTKHVSELTPAERAKSLPLLHQLQYGEPESEGAPEAFFPVRGDELAFVASLHERCILYAWLDDCEPCDLMRESFDEIFEAPPEDILLVAVYGPNWTEELREYDVDVGPATLFLWQGDVDTRFYGAQETSVIENEVDILRELH